MTASSDTRRRGRPIFLVLALGWVTLGIIGIEDGRTWYGAAGIGLGLLVGASYLWPDSAVARFMLAPLWRRKRPADR